MNRAEKPKSKKIPPDQTEAVKAMDQVKALWKKVKEAEKGSPEYAGAIEDHKTVMARYQEIKKREKPQRISATPESKSEVALPEKPKYTLEDLKKEEEWDSGFGPNNPGAFDRQMKMHRRRLREIRQSLIEQGLLEKTEQERVTEELDRLHPYAKSRTIVEHNGRRYQIRYYPLEESNSGKTVFEWGHRWVLLDD